MSIRARIIFIIVLLIVLISMSIAGYFFISSSASKLDGLLSDLEKNIKNENWARAETISSQLKESWDNSLNLIELLKDQGELHDLDMELVRINSLVNEKQKKNSCPR